MNCPNCGAEVNENQKFCTKCGAKLNQDTEEQQEIKQEEQTQDKNQDIQSAENPIKQNKNLLIILIVVFCLLVGGVSAFVIQNNVKQNNVKQNNVKQNNVKQNNVKQNNETVSITQEQQKTPDEILQEIEKYQARYWEIIKRNNVLLDIGDSDEREQDLKELSNLFKEIEKKIDPNNKYYKEYKTIQDKFKENPGETTLEMNEFATKEYETVDKLLNDVYKAVKQKLSEDDFTKLRTSQRNWLKEVNAYNKVFEAQGFGTIGTIVGLGYEIDMKNFRTLLLMFYLTDPVAQQEEVVDTYKSIIPIEKSELNRLSSTIALNLMIQQDKDMMEYVNTHKDVNSIFEVFYKNLSELVNIIDVDELDITADENSNYTLNPETQLIDFQVNDVSAVWINIPYIQEKYSKHLNNMWKEYLKLSANSIENNMQLGMLADNNQLVNEIVSWQKFITKYPNFIMNNEIKSTIKYLSQNIIYRDDMDYTFNYENNVLSDEAKQGYELYLKKVDKNTNEYNAVKKCYDILEKNNFKSSADFFKALYDFSGNSYHKELSENRN